MIMKKIALGLVVCMLLSCHHKSGDATAPSVSRVEARNGVPTLIINDRASAPTSLYVYNAESTVAYDSADWLDTFKGYVDKAKTTGVTYLAFALYFHSAMFKTTGHPAVIGTDLDFAKMDSLFDYAYRNGVYLMPTLWVSNPPEWWAAEHRDELQIGYDESSPPSDAMLTGVSYNNPDYWAIMDEYVKTIVLRYKSHPALLGWSPSVGITRENNYGPSYLSDPSTAPESWADYSPYAKERFRAWLSGKYVTDSALQSAWNGTNVTLVTAGTPTPQAAVTSPRESVANGAGDCRPQMSDWLDFRLDEKGKEWEHFITLVKTLDGDHVLAINPAGAIFVPVGPIAGNGTADGLEWTRFSQVDMVRIHPRISFDETPGPYNTQNYSLFAFAAYARRAGKVATFALEDNGEAANGGANIESLDRIQSLSNVLASAGGGIGWSIEAGGTLPVWSAVELSEASQYMHLFDPSQRSVTAPAFALLLDPKAEQAEYPLGSAMGDGSRVVDRISFYKSLYNAGIEVDIIDAEEILADARVLNNYSGIVVADMARLNGDAARILHDYAETGGGLFIAGRNGIFDAAGNTDYSAFTTLAGLNAAPTGDVVSYATWSFDTSADPLLLGISGQTADTGNVYYLLRAGWAGSGYTELGHAATGDRPATLLKNGRTVIWLPRLELTDDGLIVSLFRNWMALSNSIGYVGCSLSMNAVSGYHSLGGAQLWSGDTGYGGGGLSVWVEQLKSGNVQDTYWSRFSAMLSAYPGPRAVWWELCPDADAASLTYDDALSVLNEIRELAPGAKVYVTGVPVYPQDGAHCSINTDQGSQATLDLAGQLVSNGAALRGPTLSLLTTSQVADDGCHANTEGEAVWGKDLLDFFGQ